MSRKVMIHGGPRSIEHIQISDEDFERRLTFVADSEENPTKYVACQVNPIKGGGWVADWPNPYTYLVFESHSYYPQGGWKDMSGQYKTIEEARDAIIIGKDESYEGFYGTAHIVRLNSDTNEFEFREEYNISYVSGKLRASRID